MAAMNPSDINATHRLAILRIEEASTKIDPVFLRTPQYSNESLNEALGTTVILKIETLNPLRSFKGRGADFLVSQSNSGIYFSTEDFQLLPCDLELEGIYTVAAHLSVLFNINRTGFKLFFL